MNWDQIQGNWKEWKGKARSKWGKLTEDEMEEASGDRERLDGLIQQNSGKTKAEARQEVDESMKAA